MPYIEKNPVDVIFRVEYQTKDQEAQRNDQDFAHVSSWN